MSFSLSADQFKNSQVSKSLITDFSVDSIKKSIEEKYLDGFIDSDTKEKALQQLDTLIKGGEGSRGGHVIGHTKSGKPVYLKQNADKYKDFSAQDHKDAGDLHADKARNHEKESYNDSPSWYSERSSDERTLANYHYKQSSEHKAAAMFASQKERHDKLSPDEKKILEEKSKQKISHHSDMMEHHSNAFSHFEKEKKKYKEGSSKYNASHAEAERHLAEMHRHKFEKENLEKSY